jgi:probable HAF family extracellular repeat protein
MTIVHYSGWRTKHKGSASRRGPRFSPRLEILEDRTLLTTYPYQAPILIPSFSGPNGINAAGQVVGFSYVNGADQAVLYSHLTGQTTDLALGGSSSSANGINASGQAAASAEINGQGHAFLYSGGQITDLKNLGGSHPYATATAINAKGQVVGTSYSAAHQTDDAFLYSGGTMQDLSNLGSTNPSSGASSINASGQVVGSTAVPPYGYDEHAFLYSGGQMMDLKTLGGNNSYALGINASGQVVGDSDTVPNSIQNPHAFLYAGGHMTDLKTLGGISSYAFGINASGQVVGEADTASGVQHAFLYSGGHMMDLNSLIPPNSGWTLEGAAAINDAGVIVGGGSLGTFLLEPADLVTPIQLAAIYPKLSISLVQRYDAPLNWAMREFQINTPARVAAFLGQVAVESTQLTQWVEGGVSGMYIGRGPIQLTGLSNYTAAGANTDYVHGSPLDIVANPALVADNLNHPDIGFRTSAWFWKANGLNQVADQLTLPGTTVNQVVQRATTLVVYGPNGNPTYAQLVAKGLLQRIDFTCRAYQILTGLQLPGTPTRLQVTPSGPVTAGTPVTITVRAIDNLGHTATGYDGRVYFTSTDKLATLPASYTFTASDNGTHTFTVTLRTIGSQTITFKGVDSATSLITGTLTVTVAHASASAAVLNPSGVLAPSAVPGGNVAPAPTTVVDGSAAGSERGSLSGVPALSGLGAPGVVDRFFASAAHATASRAKPRTLPEVWLDSIL